MEKINLNINDITISCSSGVIAGAMDIFWVGDLSISEAHTWGAEQTNRFVIKVAKSKGYKGKELAGAIDYLEDYAPILADKTTSDFGGGLHHHLRDFSHHPTLVGLIFSLLNEFTGYGYGTNTKGEFIKVKIDGWERKGLIESIYSGTIKWTLHLISDIAGSSGSVRMGKEGTGIPGPLMSTLKEISTIPGLSGRFRQDEKGNDVLSVACQKLFNGTLFAKYDENGRIIKDSVVKFDMRTELGLVHEPIRTKQYLPILLSEGIICAFYSVSRLFKEINEKAINSIDDIRNIDFSKFLPWKSDELKRMRTISSLSFSIIDMSCAAISSYLECDGDKARFALGFAKRVNYFGVGRLIIAGTGEFGIKLDKIYDEYRPIVENLSKEKIPVSDDIKDITERGTSTFFSIAGMGTPVGFVAAAIGVFEEIKTSSDEYKAAREERIRIEQECEVAIKILQQNRNEMENIVSKYMLEHLSVFGEGIDMMNEALENDDTDRFIQGNNIIQKELGCDSSFSSQDEFDDLMLSDEDFKL